MVDMAKPFRSSDPDRCPLIPPALADCVPEDHLVRFVRDIGEALDLRAITTLCGGARLPEPRPAHDDGDAAVRRTRRARSRARRSTAWGFGSLAAGNQPDFRTISEFRRRHGAARAALFVQTLMLYRQAGLLTFGPVAVDGTKVKADVPGAQGNELRADADGGDLPRAGSAGVACAKLRRRTRRRTATTARVGAATNCWRNSRVARAGCGRSGGKGRARGRGPAEAANQTLAAFEDGGKPPDGRDAAGPSEPQRNYADPEAKFRRPATASFRATTRRSR